MLRIQNNFKNITQKILRHQNKMKRDRLTNEKNKYRNRQFSKQMLQTKKHEKWRKKKDT